jgi:hypothetical protein
MNKYMSFTPTGGTEKKFTVAFESFLEGLAPNKIINRKPNGAANVQVGASYALWQVVAVVPATPDTGYASIADVRAWFADQTLNGSSGSLKDHDYPTSTAKTVAIRNEYAPQYLDTQKTRALIPIIFEQIA